MQTFVMAVDGEINLCSTKAALDKLGQSFCVFEASNVYKSLDRCALQVTARRKFGAKVLGNAVRVSHDCLMWTWYMDLI